MIRNLRATIRSRRLEAPVADARPSLRQRLDTPSIRAAGRILTITIIGVEVLWIAFAMAYTALNRPAFGLDYRMHVEAAQRMLDTGTPYLPFQLAGPFVISHGAILYPPIAFILLIPFIWLPAVLWWVIPIAITAYGIWWWRPPLYAWVVIASIFSLEKSLNVYVFGNPSMWMVAAVAAGTVWRWPFVFVFAKPTFAPIAFLGLLDRRWWIALGVLAGVSLVFGSVWFDWFTVVRNSNVPLIYNITTVPLMLAPLIAWASSQRRFGSRPSA